jgi:hypothetical protein
MWNNNLPINEIPKWSKMCHQMLIPWVISVPIPYVVMSNPLITHIKTKNWFVPSMFCPNKFFELSIFVWLDFSNLNFTFGCPFNFQILINVIGNYENYTKNEDFYFVGYVLHTKSTLIIYQKVIKLGISKPTLTHNIYVLSTK